MLTKQPASLGGFEFDAIIKRSETMTCDVPEYDWNFTVQEAWRAEMDVSRSGTRHRHSADYNQ